MREDPAERKRYRRAMREIERLMGEDPPSGTPAGSQLLRLTEWVVVYENRLYPFPKVSAAARQAFREEQLQMGEAVPDGTDQGRGGGEVRSRAPE